MSIRAFFAVPLPGALVEQLTNIVADLAPLARSEGLEMKWVEPENFHVTLRFLGNVEESQLAGLRALAEEAAEKADACDARLRGVGFFPNANKPRVLHVVVEAPGALRGLAGALEEGLRARRYPPADHGFQPHITLARVKSGGAAPRLAAKAQSLAVSGVLPVREFLLLQSETLPQGPKYTPLLRAPLRGLGE
jgi:2'-5' RNA ligase